MGPISTFLANFYQVSLLFNFISLMIIFIGGLYVAIHARKIPQWIRTPLWYVGATSFVVALTIAFQWIIGPEFVLSYNNVGYFGEMLINFNIAVAALNMLVNTIIKDIRCIKLRKPE